VPELPELQAHAERLTGQFAGATIEGFRALTFTALKTVVPDPSVTHGHRLTGVGRRGKYLLLATDATAGGPTSGPAGPGPVTFVVHLMQGGRLRPDEKQAAKPRGGIARWTFADGRALLLTEAGTERKAGVWAVAGDPRAQEPLAGLGPDADTLDEPTLADLLTGHPMRLHGFLRDQHVLAGIGRRLANEICHRAQLSPFAATAKLGEEQMARLLTAMRAVIAGSLAEERARADLGPSKERTSAVHDRAGEPCPVCGDTVQTVTYRAYTVAYCPTCQTGGKVLADNTTSRFLK
jgi:formamidopyrimidine-DNA glycosylase